jgi:23S rRNA (uridine2552-2'-O)-methyltransferase
VLAERVGPKGRVVGVDLERTAPLEDPVRVLELDFTEPDAVARISEALDGRRVDLLLCDASPKLTGVRDVDRAALEELWEAALYIADELGAGGLAIKGFPGAPADAFRKELRSRYGRVREFRPEAKRGTSKEFYWLASPARAS